jgi:tetratricopeptide (TPR) repeat protein
MTKEEAKQMENRINELEKTIISHTRKRGDIANQALEFSKKTINWFLIIIGIAMALLTFAGITTFKDVSIMADNAVDEAISKKEEKWDERFNDLERNLLSNTIPSSYNMYARLSYWNSSYREDGKQVRESQKVIDIADEILKAYPNDDLAVYNKAFSYALLGNTDQAFNNLKKAIEMNNYWKIKAPKDQDFSSICKTEEFKKLVGEVCEFEN